MNRQLYVNPVPKTLARRRHAAVIMIYFLPACLTCLTSLVSIAGVAQKKLSSQDLAYAWIKDLNQRDTVALAALYADNAAILSPNWEGAKKGPAGIREIYGRYFSGTPDLQHQLTHLITTDSALVIEYTTHGTLTNPEGNTPAYMKGKAYTLQNCTRLDIRDGKIIRQVNYFDQVAFLRQVGFFDQK
jgi:steroid delta-isomerase-like uncharacterized protein